MIKVALPSVKEFRDAWQESISPLHLSSLRIYLGGQAISLLGTWMQSTAQAWLVWELSHSTVALGIQAMLGMLPFLILGPWLGVWADRLDRRRLLLATQVTAMLLALILAVLIQMKGVQLWHVYVLALTLGVVNSLDMPAQQAFIGDLSGMAQVRPAIILNAIIVQASRMVGPSVAGWLIGQFGIAPAFWLNALSFLAVITSLLSLRTRQIRQPSEAHPLWDFREGLSFVRSQPRVQDVLILTAIIACGANSILQLLPAFTGEVLHGQAKVLGLLLGAAGMGTLVGTVVLVPLAQRLRHIGLVLCGALLWTGVWYVIFSCSYQVPVSLTSILLANLTIPIILTIPAGLLQLMAPQQMRARILSIRLMLSFGLLPAAYLLTGFIASLIGTALTILISAGLMVGSASLLLAGRRQLRTWETS